VKLMLDKGEPFVSANTRLRCGEECHPLLLAAHFASTFTALGFNTNEKINLLLERGADVMIRNKLEMNCLHLIFDSVRISNDIISSYEAEMKDTLMCLVTAGADVYACDKFGESVSEAACKGGFEDLWIVVLAECGYDPEPFLQCLDHHYRRKNPGLGAFARIVPQVRSTRLSFAEYGKQRKSLPVISQERVDDFEVFANRLHKLQDLLKHAKEESEGEDDDNDNGKIDNYSTEHGADW
jgi:hypothetical protein